MIKPLLEYQAIEREKLALQAQVNEGRSKRELDEATKTREAASGTVRQLASDAEVALGYFESVQKNLSEVLAKLEQYRRNAKKGGETEEAITADMTFVSGLLSKVSGYESQLSDIANKSANIKSSYEKSVTNAKRAAEIGATAGVKFEKESKEIAPKIAALDTELKKLASKVDPALFEKFKQIRKQNQRGDIAVPALGNRCGGCRFELPLSSVHTLSGKGYIICEECGKIIYKA
jgi:predicted  nucleic acid-binding Zn-ribbon protein